MTSTGPVHLAEHDQLVGVARSEGLDFGGDPTLATGGPQNSNVR
jgi:hypothetical protein